MPTIERLLRYTLPVVFLLTALGWWQQLSGTPDAVSWPMILYLALQSFLLNAPAAPNMPILLSLMQFLAPASLATVALAVFGRLFNLEVRRWTALLIHRNQRRVVLVGTGWGPTTHVTPFPKETHAFVLADLPTGPDRTILAYPSVTVQTLKKVGVRKASRVFIYPSNNVEAWQLLGLLGKATQKSMRRVSTTILADHFSDAEVLLNLKQEVLQKVLGLSGSLELRFERIEDLTARTLVDTYAPHRHPQRQASLTDEGAHVIIQGSGDLAAALAREVLNHLHYPAGPKLQLTLVGGSIPGPPGIESVAEVKMVPFANLDGSFAGNPQTVFVVAKTISELYAQVRAWHQNAWLSEQIAPFIVPVLSGGCDLTLRTTADRQFRSLGENESGLGLQTTETGLDWSRLLEGHESFEQVARALHGSWEDSPGITGMDGWSNLSQAEREMNLRPARHLALKLWFLGQELEIVEGGSFDPTTQAQGKALADRIAGDKSLEEVLMRAEHQRWNAEKITEGFLPLPLKRLPLAKPLIKHLKDQLRIHANLCEFSQLPFVDKEKDKASFQLAHIFTTCGGLRLKKHE